jgi:hypothetical protein
MAVCLHVMHDGQPTPFRPPPHQASHLQGLDERECLTAGQGVQVEQANHGAPAQHQMQRVEVIAVQGAVFAVQLLRLGLLQRAQGTASCCSAYIALKKATQPYCLA